MVPKKILTALALWIGLSQAASADESLWNWLYVWPAKSNPTSKSVWYTDQGTAQGSLTGQRFDIRIGGGATPAEPDHLDLYELRGTIRGGSVSATLSGLDTDDGPQRFSGKLVTKEGADRISLMGTDGAAIFLYRPAKNSN